MAKVKRLTDQIIRNLPTPKKWAKIRFEDDTRGFGVRTTPKGTKSYVYVYRSPITGDSETYVIGPYETTQAKKYTVARARNEAAMYRRDKRDPQVEKKVKLAAQKADREAETVSDLCDQYVKDHLPQKRPSSQYDDRNRITLYILPELGTRKIKDVTKDEAQTFLDEITEERSPRVSNRVRSLSSTMFTMAVRKGYRPDNPFTGTRKNPEPKRDEHLTKAEIGRLMTELDERKDEDAADAVRLLIFTGLRRGEVLKAEWKEIDFERKIWRIPQERMKTKSEHLVKLEGETLAILQRRNAQRDPENPSPHVFPSPRKHDAPLQDIKTFWNTIKRRAGIERCHLHDLRHTTAAIAISMGYSLEMVGQMLGHRQYETTKRYAHLHDEVQRKMAAGISGFITKAAESHSDAK